MHPSQIRLHPPFLHPAESRKQTAQSLLRIVPGRQRPKEEQMPTWLPLREEERLTWFQNFAFKLDV